MLGSDPAADPRVCPHVVGGSHPVKPHSSALFPGTRIDGSVGITSGRVGLLLIFCLRLLWPRHLAARAAPAAAVVLLSVAVGVPGLF